MMGSGKSHIGRKLASQMGWQFVDTDRRIERAEKMTIAEFYHTAGEKAFRERETNVLYQVSRYHVYWFTNCLYAVCNDVCKKYAQMNTVPKVIGVTFGVFLF